MASQKSLNLSELFYKKSETYSKTEINNLLANLDIVELVNTLPSTNIKEKLYIIPNSNGQSESNYDVYIYDNVNSKWVKIDELNFSIADYVKIVDIINNLTSTATDKPLSAYQGKVLKSAVDGKAPTSHASTATTYGVSSASNYGHSMATSTTPKMDGTASVGSETAKFARGDHVHPTDTSRAAASHTHTKSQISDLADASSSSSGLMSSTDKSKLNGISEDADAVSFSRSLSSGTKVGTITINGTATDLYCNNDTNTTYSAVTQSANGLMTSSDKQKLDKSMAISSGNVAGTTSVFTASLSGVTLTHGTLIVLYNAVGANAANATLNVNSLGAKPIYYNASAIPASRFPNKATCLFMYNTTIVSTGCWQLIYSYDSNSTYTAESTATNIKMNGTQSAGSLTTYARGDHVHPTDTSRASTSVATTSANGLMSSTDKTKLDGIATGANKITVDSSVSDSSTNPIQNKVIKGYVDEQVGDIISGDVDLSSTHTHTKSQITDFPTSMTPTSHSHGSLANGGTLNSDITSVNKVAVTDSSNNLKTISKIPFANLNISKTDITGLGIPSSDTNTTYTAESTATNIKMNGTQSAGSLTTYARGDHVHPVDTSRAASSHAHGNITSAGVITNQASKNVVTDANGKITTEAKPTIPTGSSTATDIKMNGTQSAGSSSNFAKADHVHPVDTSRAASSHTHTKSQITDFPSTMTPSSHTHGNVTNDGKIGSTANLPVVTGTSGALTTGSFESTATNIKMNGTQSVGSLNTFARADHVHPVDTSRAAASHTHTKANITDFPTSMTPTSHQADTNTYGAATTSKWGHTKLSNATNSSAEDVAATPKAVKAAYDLANSKPSYADQLYTAQNGFTLVNDSGDIVTFLNDKLTYTVDDDKLSYTNIEGIGGELATSDWESISVSKGTLKVNKSLKLAQFSISETRSINDTSEHTLQANNIPAVYRPSEYIYFLAHSDVTKPIYYFITAPDGTLKYRAGVNPGGSKTIGGSVMWHYE